MKTLVLGTLVAAVLAPVAAFAGNWGMSGCGFGSTLFEDRGKGLQILSATSNGLSGNQTFGISSGTSNCSKDGAVATDKQRQAFAEAALPSILRDMAVGQGEYVAALGELYGCSDKGVNQFSSAMQKNFSTICAKGQCTGAHSFLNSTEKTLSSDATLAQECVQLAKANEAANATKVALR